MKKFYTLMLFVAAMFTSAAASAQVETLADLFGTYNFSATLEIVDQAAADKFKSECEVTIKKGDAYIDAYLCGLAGVEEGEQPIYKLNSDKNGIILRNVNGGNWDAWGSLGYYMTDIDGNNPYAVKYSDIVFSFDPATLSFTLPDFSFVAINDWNAEKGTVVAKFTNVKMTLKEKETIEIPNISGNYHFAATSTWDYGKIESWPTEFDMTVTAKDETNKAYTVEWAFETLGTFTFDGKFDGQKLAVAFDNMCVDKERNIFLAPSYGITLESTADFNLVGENLSLSSGVSFAVPYYKEEVLDSLDYIFWYGAGIAKTQKQQEVKFSYTGKYNATATVAYDLSDGKVPASGPIEIEYDDNWDIYLITNFMGYDTYTLNQGGIEFKPDADDPMKGTIVLQYNYLDFIEETAAGDWKYYVLLDGNLQGSYINVTFNEDGTMNLGEFCVGTGTFMGTEDNALVTWYSGLTATKSNPSSPKDWIGDHTVNAIAYAYTAEGASVPATGAFKVAYYEDKNEYYVEDFLGYDLYTMNYGGLPLVPDANDPHKATIQCGTADFDAETMESIDLYDKDLKSTTIEVTLNDDGTVTVGDFAIAKGPWGAAPTTIIAATSAATGVSAVKSNAAATAEFNLTGAKVNAAQKGITIKNVNGKYIKVLNK